MRRCKIQKVDNFCLSRLKKEKCREVDLGLLSVAVSVFGYAVAVCFSNFFKVSFGNDVVRVKVEGFFVKLLCLLGFAE